MLSALAADMRTSIPGALSTPSQSAESTSFADILVSATGTSSATAAAATAASADVEGLAHLVQGLGGNPNNATISMETIDRSGHVLAGASLDGDGDLAVFGTGSSGGATSTVKMLLSSQADGGTWYEHASAELAQASYELNALAAQSLAATNAGLDRSA